MMKKSLYVLVAVLSVFGLVVWLSACGGGGSGGSGGSSSGDDGGGGGTTPTTTGPTYQLDEEGVQAALEYVADLGIGCDFESGGEVSTAVRNVSEVGAEMADQIVGRFLAARSARNMDRALLGEDPVNETINEAGPCGGALTGQIVDTGSTLDIDLDFDNVCIELGDMDGDGLPDEVTIDGSLNFGGSYVESGGDLSSISISGGTGAGGIDIDVAGESASIILTGFNFIATGLDVECGASLSLDIDYFSLTLPVDGSTETLTVEDLAVVATTVPLGSAGCGATVDAEATITTDEGTLDISTPTAITVDGDGDVESGEILLEGAGGTSVSITYAGTTTEPYVFTVAADTDGDGTAAEVGSMDCSDLEGIVPSDL
jgi:hypothetical protein